MIGIVIVSHSNIAKEFIEVIEHIVGKQEKVYAVSIFPEDNMESKRNEILDCVKKAQSGKGVIVLTDMFGGTPSNLALSVMENEKIEVVAGVNLPMLIKMMSLRKKIQLKMLLKNHKKPGESISMWPRLFLRIKKIARKKVREKNPYNK